MNRTTILAFDPAHSKLHIVSVGHETVGPNDQHFVVLGLGIRDARLSPAEARSVAMALIEAAGEA